MASKIRHFGFRGHALTCRWCGEQLKPFPFAAADWAVAQNLTHGYDGERLFCTRTCAAQLGAWAVKSGNGRAPK